MKGCILNGVCFVFSLVIGIFLMVNANLASAADICVGTAEELNIALATAASNGQDDVIKIVQETYNGNFIYASTEAFGVTIEGGYISGCASRVVDATNTVLDAQGNGTVLVLSAPEVSVNFMVDGITIQNGNFTGGTTSGVYINSDGGRVEFSNNILNNSTFGVHSQVVL